MMPPAAMKRLILMIAFTLTTLCLVVNLLRGAELLYAAFTALCVMLASSIILYVAVRRIAESLARFVLSNELADQSGQPEQLST